jgi:hypothetical protein
MTAVVTTSDLSDLLADLSKIGPPPWVSYALTFGLPLVGSAMATVDPAHTIPTPDAKALVIVAGFVLGVAAHLIGVLRANGLTKAGLQRTWTDEEQWLRTEAPAIKDVYERGKVALDAIPGVPQALAAVQAKLAELEKMYDGLPAAQRDAALAAVHDVLGIKA